MLTFFTTAKPFRGHDAIIQRNALQSWKLLHPDVEVILFGDDEGAAEACATCGVRHEPHVKLHQSGVKRLDYIFERAGEMSKHQYLCFANCDIVLMSDFLAAFERARSWRKRFLMVAQRWDTDVTEPIEFTDPQWPFKLRQFAANNGFRQDEYWIDLFLFHKGLYVDMPPLLVGHCYWDNWAIWKALRRCVPVLDCTSFVSPIHQNHGYNPTFGRVKGLALDPISLVNLQLAGGKRHLRTIKSSTHYMTHSGQIRLRLYRRSGFATKPVRDLERFLTYQVLLPAWHFLLNITRPVRSLLGLRLKTARPQEKARSRNS